MPDYITNNNAANVFIHSMPTQEAIQSLEFRILLATVRNLEALHNTSNIHTARRLLSPQNIILTDQLTERTSLHTPLPPGASLKAPVSGCEEGKRKVL